MRKLKTAAKIVGTCLLLTVPATAGFAEDGDPAKGKKVFRKCQACHTFEEGVNRVGPHLFGIFGRTAGTVEDFNYSDAMVNSGIVWDEESLAAYLTKPKDFIPGNRMVFNGLRKESQIVDLMAYLKEMTQ